MTMLKIQSTRKNEKGIALIFTLVMLSLLMILALSFALDSMFSQKAAYNSASSSSSGFMGQAQLNQVLLLMKNSEANFDGGRLYSKDISYDPASPSTSVEDTDMLVDRLPVDGVLASDDGVLDPTVKVNWNYTQDADGKIIGRTAFVVIPEDKVPLDSLVSKTLAEQSFSEDRIGKDVSEINVAVTGITGTRGPLDIVNIITPLNWEIKGGKYTGTWGGFSQIFKEINDNLTTDLTESEEDVFEQRLSISVNKTKEVFWANTSGVSDTKKESGEFYNRFNLTRTDWDKASNAEDITFIKEEILLTNDASSSLDMDMDAWTEGVANTDGHGLPWLACFGYKSDGDEDSSVAGTFANVKDRRYQIAANLKDYCDSDSYPTSDVDPRGASATNWKNSATHPTYTGNEETPYIDKLGLAITAVTVKEENTGTTSNPNDGWLYANVEIVPCAGLIYMYGASWTDNLIVYVDMDVNFTGKVNTTDFTHTENVKLTIDVGSWLNGYTNFAWAAGTSSLPTTKIAADPIDSAKLSLTLTDIKINKAVLFRDNSFGGDADCYDYVKSLEDTTAVTLFDKVVHGNSVDYLTGWAAHDARQNLNGTATAPDGSQDWKFLGGQKVDLNNPHQVFSYEYSWPYYVGKPNCQNSTYGIGVDTDKPSDGDGINTDMETGVTDSADHGVSTAHIRNEPMKSPWELGFIHRGKKWQTINLKVYDTSKAYQVTKIPATTGKDYILGGGLYSSGDANILDQIKMSSETETLQKIALDTKNDDPSFTLMALLSWVYYGCTIDSNMTDNSLAKTGTKLNYKSTDVNTLCSAIKTFYDNSANPENRLTRASVVSQLLLSTTSTPDLTSPTDAQQEELIGKVVNLTKIAGTDGDFTIIILAQTIKDVGGDGSDIDIARTSADGLATHTVSCRLGRFDLVASDGNPATTLDSDWKKNLYGDEITGEQKIMVKGNISNGTLTIKSFQYIE